MPSRKIELAPFAQIEPRLRDFLLNYFPAELVDKVFQSGGRLTISLRAGPKKVRRREDLDIAAFVTYLRNFNGNERELRERLEPLMTKQLRGLAREFKIPIKSKVSTADLISGLVSYVTSSKKWTSISGVSPERRSDRKR